MIDWEGIAELQIARIQRALPAPIRIHANQVPVFLDQAGRGKNRACLGLFEGFSLAQGPPAQPDELPRITLFIDALARATNYEEAAFIREVRVTYFHELGHYLGWDEGQIAQAGLE